MSLLIPVPNEWRGYCQHYWPLRGYCPVPTWDGWAYCSFCTISIRERRERDAAERWFGVKEAK